MLGVIFWMYGGYAWLTNSVVVDRLARRLTLAGFLVVALAVPGAFEGSGIAFGLAYLAVVLVHLGMFTLSSRLTVKQAILGLAPFNVSSALLVLVGLILLGIIVVASALKETTAHPFDALNVSKALALGGGVAILLLGEALFRGTLSIGAARMRGAAAVLALATVPVGLAVSAVAQLAVVVVVLVGMLLWEQVPSRVSRPGHRRARPPTRRASRGGTARSGRTDR